MTSEKLSLRPAILGLVALMALGVGVMSTSTFAQDEPTEASAVAAVEEAASEAPAAEQAEQNEAPAQEAPEETAEEETAVPEATPVVVEPVDQKADATGYFTIIGLIILVVVGWWLGRVLGKRFRTQEYSSNYAIIIICFVASLVSMIVGIKQNRVNLGVDLRGGSVLVYEVQPVDGSDQKTVSNEDMSKLKNAIMQRINPSGVREISIQELGANTEIKITIPEADPAEVARLERVINDTGQLSFRILANNASSDEDEKAAIALATNPERADIKSDVLPELIGDGIVKGYTWLPVDPTQEDSIRQGVVFRETTYQPREDEIASAPRYDVLVLELIDSFEVNGSHISFVQESIGSMGEPEILFTMTATGSKHMQNLTDRYKASAGRDQGRQLGVVFNNRLFSAPNIKSTISDHGTITFGSDLSPDSRTRIQQEVRDLIAVMHAGVLPAKLSDRPVTKQITGPTLGADTIQRGLNAVVWSSVVVLIFMIIYYGFGGVVAAFAVIMNLFLIMMAMIGMRAAFTLPGLAGLALTVGMAVDANVLIFERIREELTGGATVRMAIRNGYERAFTAIFDSNITTMLTAAILYIVGAEQIKSFAVTLFLGVLFNLFTACYVCRTIFVTMERIGVIGKKCVSPLLPGMKQLGCPNFDFFKLAKKTLWVSILVIVVGLAAVFARGKGIFDVDFVGGVEVQIVFNEPVEIDELRESLSDDLPDLTVSALALAQDQEGNVVADNTCYAISASSPPDKQANDFQADVENLLKEKFDGKLRTYAMDYTVGAPTEVSTVGSDAIKTETTVALTIKPALAREVIEGYFAEARPEGSELTFVVTREGYEEGSTEAATDWNVVFESDDVDAVTAFADAAQTRVNNQIAFEASNTVGSSVASYARTQGVWAILGSLVCIIGYLWLRFKRAVFGISAVVGLVHDVLVTLGLIGLSYYVAGGLAFLGITQFKIGVATVAAFLTLIGYSLNDTIVVFDRMREIRGKSEALTIDIINKSINQCLSRTILTSLTTLFSALVLYMFGGPGIHTFSFAMIVGIVAGTYSSIFICSPFLYWLMSRKASKTPSQRTR